VQVCILTDSPNLFISSLTPAHHVFLCHRLYPIPFTSIKDSAINENSLTIITYINIINSFCSVYYLFFSILPMKYMAVAPTYMTNWLLKVPNVLVHSPTSEKWRKA